MGGGVKPHGVFMVNIKTMKKKNIIKNIYGWWVKMLSFLYLLFSGIASKVTSILFLDSFKIYLTPASLKFSFCRKKKCNIKYVKIKILLFKQFYYRGHYLYFFLCSRRILRKQVVPVMWKKHLHSCRGLQILELMVGNISTQLVPNQYPGI